MKPLHGVGLFRSPSLAAGFTLLEMAVVLALIGVIAGGGMVLLTASMKQTAYNATVAKMDRIEKALLNYGLAFHRLPCPANLSLAPTNSKYGIEAANQGTCTGGSPAASFAAASGTVEGAVPTRALQLPDSYMYDAWGGRIRYAVDPSVTITGTLPTGVYSACAVNTTGITVNNSTGAARTTAAAYALISHGANGHGAYTSAGNIINGVSTNADELTNCHCGSNGAAGTYTPTYVQKAPTQDPSNSLNSFDDIVAFKEAWQIQALNIPLSITGTQCVYVVDSGNARVQIFNTNGTYVGQFGSAGAGDGQFVLNSGESATNIAVDAIGNVYVGDGFYNTRVEKFTSTGSYLLQFATSNHPSIAIDASNNVWIANLYSSLVQEFNSSGTLLTSFGSNGSANGQFSWLEGIAIDAHGYLWVADTYNNRVEEFTSSGTWQQSIGGPSPYTCETSPAGTIPSCASGAGNGQLTAPGGIAFDSSGNLDVSDLGNYRIQTFNTSGVYRSQFGSWGYGNGQWRSGAGGFAIDASGNIWVAGGPDNRVQKLDSNGNFLSQIGCASGACSSGSGNGQFNNPIAIAIK